jgi:uncharacterized caspase-like protein
MAAMTYLRHLSALLLAVGFVQASIEAAWADKRVALLIGNSSYRGVTKLDNPPRDIEMLGAALSSAGFDRIETKVDLDRETMIRTLRTFEDEAAAADIAVIYFSGHGLEMNGENFLVPVDAKLATDRDVEDETVTLSRMLRTVDGAKRLKLIILDACRNNPFLANMKQARSTRSVSRGLVEVEPQSSDTLVAYAAKAGTVAWDGTTGSSPFALSLARRLIEPGVDIRLALGKVRDDVLAATNRLQEPFAYGSLGGATVTLARDVPVVATAVASPLPEPAPAPATPVVGSATSVALAAPLAKTPALADKADPCADAAAHWAAASKFNRRDFYEKHIQLFGSCPFVDFARAKLEELDKGGEPVVEQPKASQPTLSQSKTPAAQPKRAVKPTAPQKKQVKQAKRIKPVKNRSAAPADDQYVAAREVEMEPAPMMQRRQPTIMFGFGRGGGHHGLGLGGIGIGF